MDNARQLWQQTPARFVQVFEALTHKRAFCGFGSAAVVLAAAAGESPYPWEAGAPDGVPSLFQRSKLRDVVLSCLAHDPRARATAIQLRARIDSIGQSTATQALVAPAHTEPNLQALAPMQPDSTLNAPTCSNAFDYAGQR